jgi:hypothetical protein
MQSFAFGSIAGSTFAFYLFALFALLAGLTTYGLLRVPQARRIDGTALTRPKSVVMSTGIGVLILAGLYLSSLNGFYRLELRDEELRLGYIIPLRTVVVRRGDVSEVRTRAAYKGRWRLVIYTLNGSSYASARGGDEQVREAWDYLNPMLNVVRQFHSSFPQFADNHTEAAGARSAVRAEPAWTIY